MSQEEREAALIAQAREHRKNHPSTRGRHAEVENDEGEATPHGSRPRRKYERRQPPAPQDKRPGAGTLTLGWVAVTVAAQIPVPVIALSLYALAIVSVIRVFRAHRVGRVGKFFAWVLVVQIGYSLAVSTLMAWPILSRLIAVLMLPNPTIG